MRYRNNKNKSYFEDFIGILANLGQAPEGLWLSVTGLNLRHGGLVKFGDPLFIKLSRSQLLVIWNHLNFLAKLQSATTIIQDKIWIWFWLFEAEWFKIIQHSSLAFLKSNYDHLQSGRLNSPQNTPYSSLPVHYTTSSKQFDIEI